MAVVRGQRIDLLALDVEREREILAVSTQKSRLKRRFRSAACLELVSEVRSLRPAREPSAAHLRVVRVALELAGRPREAGEPPVAVRDRVPRVLPALVFEAGLLVAALVPDVAACPEVRVLVDPRERRARLELGSRTSLRSPVQRSYSSSSTTYRGVASAQP
jgi:hypothetical protein